MKITDVTATRSVARSNLRANWKKQRCARRLRETRRKDDDILAYGLLTIILSLGVAEHANGSARISNMRRVTASFSYSRNGALLDHE